MHARLEGVTGGCAVAEFVKACCDFWLSAVTQMPGVPLKTTASSYYLGCPPPPLVYLLESIGSRYT
jgi:hypothetical protein